jgi:hypothetical protein
MPPQPPSTQPLLRLLCRHVLSGGPSEHAAAAWQPACLPGARHGPRDRPLPAQGRPPQAMQLHALLCNRGTLQARSGGSNSFPAPMRATPPGWALSPSQLPAGMSSTSSTSCSSAPLSTSPLVSPSSLEQSLSSSSCSLPELLSSIKVHRSQVLSDRPLARSALIQLSRLLSKGATDSRLEEGMVAEAAGVAALLAQSLLSRWERGSP